jgi:hypothetical protein
MAIQDENANRARDFDPTAASATMRKMAAQAARCSRSGLALEREFVVKAIAELRVAQVWLDYHRGDCETLERRPLVTEVDDEDRIGIEALVFILHYAAIELVRAHERLELRRTKGKR